MLVQSTRLDIVTFDETGKEVKRVCYKDYGIFGSQQAEEDMKNIALETNQKCELVNFIDSSLYEEGWKHGLIF